MKFFGFVVNDNQLTIQIKLGILTRINELFVAPSVARLGHAQHIHQIGFHRRWVGGRMWRPVKMISI